MPDARKPHCSVESQVDLSTRMCLVSPSLPLLTGLDLHPQREREMKTVKRMTVPSSDPRIHTNNSLQTCRERGLVLLLPTMVLFERADSVLGNFIVYKI